MRYLFFLLFVLFWSFNGVTAQTYTMPEEIQPHEGTWLQWPHHYQYGTTYRNRLDATWIAMTAALVQSEKVHIIAYDATEQTRITALLNTASVPLTNVDFRLWPTDDVWVRDNGPIFVRNSSGTLMVEDWGFNAWGGKFQFNNCNAIPTRVGNALGLNVINLNTTMVNEGGSVELDGRGVLMACKSSILSQSPANTVRNPGMTQTQAETIFSTNLGISKFIWLNGVTGLEVTDMHIDGFARFANSNTIVTMNNADLLNWGVTQADINTLMAASNINNTPYNFVIVPLTQNNVTTTYGETLPFKGSYANYYVGNTRVLVPNYNDPNDAVANAQIQTLYPGRTVVGIDVRNLYKNGGMVHCVTQQQPTLSVLPIKLLNFEAHVQPNATTLVTWQTANEFNTKHYEIERSIDGVVFNKIGVVNSVNSATFINSYSFTDATCQNLNKFFYRVKQIDIDGKSTYTKIVSISKNKLKIDILISPNPASSNISFTGLQSNCIVEIFDQTGKLIKQETSVISNKIISIKNFPNGFYYYKIIDAKTLLPIQTGKFIKA